ncbi:MAG: MOSC domain-containing protein [bacterium]|nr:MOSC domain-containing protein [Betaproteobacteria bacterium]
MPAPVLPLSELRSTFRGPGRVEWIGVRAQRRAPLTCCPSGSAREGGALAGDHGGGGRRAVTLIQFEHLPVIAALAGRDTLDPARLRRNVCVSGINLLALRDARFRLGTLVLEGTGSCAPCSRMDEDAVLGCGGYNAMRGHGGITARVVGAGAFSIGDPVVFLGLAAATDAPLQRPLAL